MPKSSLSINVAEGLIGKVMERILLSLYVMTAVVPISNAGIRAYNEQALHGDHINGAYIFFTIFLSTSILFALLCKREHSKYLRIVWIIVLLLMAVPKFH